MNLDPANPPRGTWIFLVGLILAAGWWSWHEANVAEQAEHRLAMRLTQWRGVAASEPTPTIAIAEALTARVESARQVVGSWQSLLGGAGDDPVYEQAVPAQRADAFFAIAQFGETHRIHAERAGVVIRDNETFSFSAHRNSGPADEHVALVHRQLVVVAALLDALWRVRPLELTMVQREDPQRKIELTKSARSGSREGSPEDWVVWPESRSLGRDGMIDSLAFQIGFVGRTATLRGFLAELADQAIPLVVRSVQVEALGANGRAQRGRRTLDDLFRDENEPPPAEGGQSVTAVPIIPANNAEFRIVVEYLDFTGPLRRREAAEREANPQ